MSPVDIKEVHVKEASSGPKDENETVKGDEKAQSPIAYGDELPQKFDKKKKKKAKYGYVHVGETVLSGSSEPQIDEGVCDQLRHLSIKSYKKLLVSIDGEEMWYEQASCMHQF